MIEPTLLYSAAERAVRYLAALPNRSVTPTPDALARLAELDGPFSDGPTDALQVLHELDSLGSPGTVASAGPRYFGYVIGGSLPATVAANWLAGAWDQNAGLVTMGPSAAKLEVVAGRWLLDALRLPSGCAVGFVTGATMANFTALAAARHALLQRAGWDVEAQGLFGAPPINVVVGDEVHASALKALALLGLGRERVVRVPTDAHGRIRAELVPPLDERSILCLQAGNVNTGACDPVGELAPRAREAGCWVHVDAAFGMWAAVSPAYAGVVEGVQEADSWALDAHKWLNVPYDSGLAIVRHADALRAAMAATAAYLHPSLERDPDAFTPELSRRARGVEVWAALRSLGRSGLADLIDRCCGHATRFAEGLRQAGFDVLNDVVLNQVLVAFGDDESTRRVIAAVQAEGTCWAGGTVWHGRAAMRISVSSWATTAEDVELSLIAIVRVARDVCDGPR